MRTERGLPRPQSQTRALPVEREIWTQRMAVIEGSKEALTRQSKKRLRLSICTLLAEAGSRQTALDGLRRGSRPPERRLKAA